MHNQAGSETREPAVAERRTPRRHSIAGSISQIKIIKQLEIFIVVPPANAVLRASTDCGHEISTTATMRTTHALCKDKVWHANVALCCKLQYGEEVVCVVWDEPLGKAWDAIDEATQAMASKVVCYDCEACNTPACLPALILEK
jgi:hypothetical protein